MKRDKGMSRNCSQALGKQKVTEEVSSHEPLGIKAPVAESAP